MLRRIIVVLLLAVVARADAPGEYPVERVVDGDTIRVDGLDNSLRLLGIDAEETFKHKAERAAYAAGWATYAAHARGASRHPVKFATPMGEAAKQWAQAWFAGVDAVRLERDDPQEIRDRYGRYLAYVFAKKDGRWLDYNVEAVRAGMAPYFPKYGRSRRYDKEFVAAEAEAKAAHRGIWAPGAEAYPDYPEREAWWNARADFVDAFRKHERDACKPDEGRARSTAEGSAQNCRVDSTHADALARLEALVGKPVIVLGTVDKIISGRGPVRVLLGSVTLVFFHDDVLEASHVLAWQGEYVTASGTPSIYVNPHTQKRQLELVIDRPSQIVVSQVPGITAGAGSATSNPGEAD